MENKYAIFGIFVAMMALCSAFFQLEVARGLDACLFKTEVVLESKYLAFYYPGSYEYICYLEMVSSKACLSAQAITVIMAFIGIILGIISFAQNEYWRRSSEVIGTAVMALCWHIPEWGPYLIFMWLLVWLYVRFGQFSPS